MRTDASMPKLPPVSHAGPVNCARSHPDALPDPDTTDPVLRAALAEGASWSRDEAVERTIGLLESLARQAPTPA